MALRQVSLASLLFDGNVRTPACLKLPLMVESIRRNGFKDNHPLVVSEKSGGGFLVLVGNRRGLALQWLFENDVPAFQSALPTGKVPCVVHKGLTPEQEADIRIDHGPDEDREPLDDWSIFLAVKQLVLLGFSQERIATKLGLKVGKKGQPNRSWVQPRCNLARLPMFVQDEYQKLFTAGKDSTAVRIPDIAKLYSAYHAEYVDHPDGDGPDFQAVWQKVMAPPEAKAAIAESEAKPLSIADAKKRAQACASKLVRDVLLAAVNASSKSLAELDKLACEYEYSHRKLATIKVHLGEEAWNELHKSTITA